VESDRLNKWLTLVANLGVLFGLVLLIFEIHQNNSLMQVQIEESRSKALVAWRRQIVGNEVIAGLYAKTNNLEGPPLETWNQLTPIEQVQLRYLISADFYAYENMYSQYERGFISEEYWQERIVPVIRARAQFWNVIYPPDGPIGRRAFKDDVERIFRERVETPGSRR